MSWFGTRAQRIFAAPMVGYQRYLAQVKAQIVETPADELKARAAAVLIDVRELDEYNQGCIPGALLIPRGSLERRIEEAVAERDTDLVVYCAGGSRSALAAKTLAELGYTRVRSLAGGFSAWKSSGGAIELPLAFTPAQATRYARHTMLAEVGEKGQGRLLQSKVLLIGVGGLGSPAALYLAAAGVGTLGVVDDDTVDASNLQRQILHSTASIGLPKVDSAARTLEGLNPDVQVRRYQTRLSRDNVVEILADYDLVVDGSDNFPTRYLLNDAALLLKKPLISASIFRFEGQVTVLRPFEGPCYRCLYPTPPPAALTPACAEAGVLGVLPGVIGVVQATEAIKLLLGIGRPLVGRLLQYDALDMRFREFSVPRNPACVTCSETAGPIALIDYEAFCRTT